MKRVPIFLQETGNNKVKKRILHCERCGEIFQPMSNRAKYCSICRPIVSREKALESWKRNGRKQYSNKNWVNGEYIKKGYNQRGKFNNNYRNGSGMNNYESAVRIYGEKCNRCSSKENLLLHHFNNNPKNWEILCKGCHQNHHSVRCEETGRFISNKG